MSERTFIPFGEFLPDRQLFGNEGLLRAYGVVPVSGNYLATPMFQPIPSAGFNIADEPYGLGLHQGIHAASGNRRIYAYYGSRTDLWEINVTASVTAGVLIENVRNRIVGGVYAFTASPPLDTELWWFTSFGQNVIATNFSDEVQFLPEAGTGNFEDMITSTFKPQFRFTVPIRQNLFGFYCFLPATYDGIPSGTHQQLGVWSMNDNIRSFGSENVDPALIGAGYQQAIGGDFGPITAAVGGDFGLVFCAGGIVRVDGPPWEFRPIVSGDTTVYPYSVFRLGDDVYFWGNGGPSVLRNGEPPVVRLGGGTLQRSLLDTTTSFGEEFSRAVDMKTREVSGGFDAVNRLVRWSYLPRFGSYLGAALEDPGVDVPSLFVDFSLDESNRAAVSPIQSPVGLALPTHSLFLRNAPLIENPAWGPYGSLYGFSRPGGPHYIANFQLIPQSSYTTPAIEMKTGFGRLHDELTTRIVAVRPVFTSGSSLADTEVAVAVTVYTKNKPYEPETSTAPASTIGTDGWVGVEDAVLASYQAIGLKLTGTNAVLVSLTEIEGVEIQYVTGGAYGA